MCSKLPIIEPTELTMPTLVLRGQYDGIAGFDDLLEYFRLLPNPDKQFIVMPGTAHSSLHGKNFKTSLHIFESFWRQPEPIYQG
jgi:pimeloyl-ACP methyl ester carboxylesterase